MKGRTDVRVNLRIGARTDSALRQLLIACAPYQRGKLAKSLMLDGLRFRAGESARLETATRPATPSNAFRESMASAFKKYVLEKPRSGPNG